MMPMLLVFGLLLANLAQLQPGTGGEQPLFSRISLKLEQIRRFSHALCLGFSMGTS